MSLVAEKLVAVNPRLKLADNGKLYKVGNSGRETPLSLSSLQGRLDWPEFCAAYLAEYPLPVRFAYGEDIQEVFNQYRPGSCMRGPSRAELRTVYVENPDDVCAAYLIADEHELLCSNASCLVWLGESRNYVDRTYSDGWAWSGGRVAFLEAIASKLSGETYTIYDNDSGAVRRWTKRVSFRLHHDSDILLPYCDTVGTIADYGSDYVKLSSGGDGPRCDNVGGTSVDGDDDRYTCDHCGDRIDEDEVRSTDYNTYCGICYDELYSYCEVLEEDFCADDVNYYENVYYNGRYRGMNVSDEAIRREFYELHDGSYSDEAIELHDGEYALTDDAIELHDGQYALCDDAIELHDGQYATADEAIELHDGQYALCDDAIELHDGQYALCDDAVELHNGEYALCDDAIELSPEIYNPGKFALRELCLFVSNVVLVSDFYFFHVK